MSLGPGSRGKRMGVEEGVQCSMFYSQPLPGSGSGSSRVGIGWTSTSHFYLGGMLCSYIPRA